MARICPVTYGLKMLREQNGKLLSLSCDFEYPLDEWKHVPGNGSYVAVTWGLWAGGHGGRLFVVESKGHTRREAPEGVMTFALVRIRRPTVELLRKCEKSVLDEAADEAAGNDREDYLKLCIETGAKPTQTGASWGARLGYARCLKLCIETGVKPTNWGANGAAERGHAECIKLCVEAGVIGSLVL